MLVGLPVPRACGADFASVVLRFGVVFAFETLATVFCLPAFKASLAAFFSAFSFSRSFSARASARFFARFFSPGAALQPIGFRKILEFAVP